MIKRMSGTLALVLVLVLSGAGIGHAYWSAHGELTGRVAVGTLSMTQTGVDGLAAAFTTDVTEVTAPVVVTNDGTVSAPFALSFTGAPAAAEGTGQSSGDLGAATLVSVWPAADAASCASVPAGDAPDGSTSSTGWNAIPPLLGTLEPGGSAVHCVRAVIDPARAAPGDTVVVTSSLTSGIGSWSSTSTADFGQSFSDDAIVSPHSF
ncbi:hypothetical protein [Planctomonas psychrotolerans]|uniref:hypothetical protein n=1 Tax=Planctomonas psychrotolerans TaxID=2528712 RepID=UPI00123ADD3F|nr:hypothetical protein [Planctomonas psychrotolerans]